MPDTLICEAIRGRRLMMYEYGGLIRVVEPHLYGENNAGHALLSGWLRPGYSRSDPQGGWRTWRVDRIGSAQLLDEPFPGPRPGYNPGDARMARVFCALSAAALVGDGDAAPTPPDLSVQPEDGPPDAMVPATPEEGR